MELELATRSDAEIYPVFFSLSSSSSASVDYQTTAAITDNVLTACRAPVGVIKTHTAAHGSILFISTSDTYPFIHPTMGKLTLLAAVVKKKQKTITFTRYCKSTCLVSR